MKVIIIAKPRQPQQPHNLLVQIHRQFWIAKLQPSRFECQKLAGAPVALKTLWGQVYSGSQFHTIFAQIFAFQECYDLRGHHGNLKTQKSVQYWT